MNGSVMSGVAVASASPWALVSTGFGQTGYSAEVAPSVREILWSLLRRVGSGGDASSVARLPTLVQTGAAVSIIGASLQNYDAHGPTQMDAEALAVLLAEDVPTQLAHLAHWLSVNKSQISQIMQVSRPTLYEWLGGGMPSDANRMRLAGLLKLLAQSGLSNSSALDARFVRQPLEDGVSLLDVLSRSDLVESEVLRCVGAIRSLERVARQRELRRSEKFASRGFETVSSEARRSNLAVTAALRDWPGT